jgi:hypothetical protein
MYREILTPPVYIVIDERTLGFALPNDWAQVLHGSVLRGGAGWKNGPISTFGAVVRPATAADFDFYRVQLAPNFAP